MGYVHDTAMSQIIPPADFTNSAGTWTITLASNVVSLNRTAADAAWNTSIPISIPSNSVALKGCYLKSIEVEYAIVTAACDDFATVELEKQTFPVTAAATGTAVTGAAVTTTLDANHTTAALRYAVGNHTMVVTLTTPAWIDDNDQYVLWLVIDAAATTVFKWYGAKVNYTLRI